MNALRLEWGPALKEVRSHRSGRYGVHVVDDVTTALAAAIGPDDALLVTTPTVYELYGAIIARELELDVLVVEVDEADKGLHQVERITREMFRRGMSRRGVVVALGGGICSDLVTCAAAWFRRGIRYIPVPTTLVGQIDAGIGVKGAVNVAGKKSGMGTYHLPQTVLIHPPYLKTLGRQYISEGLSEIVKMGIIRDARLFELLDRHAEALLDSALASPAQVGREVIDRAICAMLEELEPNLFENRSWERLVDFGHSFSPALESAIDFGMHHGHAVAVDMAICGVLAHHHGMLEGDALTRMLGLLRRMELPLWHDALSHELFEVALDDCSRHRGGVPNIVLPTSMGTARVCGDRALFSDAFSIAQGVLA